MVARIAALLTFCWATAAGAGPDVVYRERGVDHSQIPKLRQWVWQHWSGHRAGTAILEWVTVEGDSGTSEYTVAKARDGTWYLSIHLQGSERPMFDGDTAKWRDEWTIAYSVSRTEAPYHDDWAGKAIQHSRPLPPHKFVLE